jgi:hypothetical protein
MSERPVLLAAGGTGGHLFPSESLAVALARRGLPVELVTDDRAIRYGGAFPARAIHTIASATPRGGSLVSKSLAALTLARGVIESLGLPGFGAHTTQAEYVFLEAVPRRLYLAASLIRKLGR